MNFFECFARCLSKKKELLINKHVQIKKNKENANLWH